MGGVGSGKTTALVWEVILLSMEYPGNYGLVGRYTYPELRDTTMYEFFNICPDELIEDRIKTEHKVIFKNGSTIIFRHLEEVDKLKSLNLGFFAIDEMTECPENVFLMLQSRLRKKEVGRRVGFGSTNPEGQDWVWHKWCKQHRGDPDYLFIQAASTENRFLPDDYVEDLRKSFPEHWIKRYIEGDPSAFAGQIITAWDESVHVIEPFEIPEDWTRGVSLDHGTNNPTAVGWWAVHPEGFKICYKEHYEEGQTVDHHAKRIFEINGSDNINAWIADPAIFNKTLQDPKRGLYSIAESYADYGIHFIQGDNDVKAGINLLIESFNVWDNLINPFTDKKGSPKVFLFKNCEHGIYEIPQYRWKEYKIKGKYREKPEAPEKANDHFVDQMRYYLMSQPQPARLTKDKFKPFKDRQERVWDTLEKLSKRNKERDRSLRVW
jgi:phage terminase large subunit